MRLRLPSGGDKGVKLQLIIAGIGGQGVLFTSRVIYEMAHRRGEAVFGSETHGMSQRGGSVLAHLKIGRFYSPLVKRGRADLLLGLEREEGVSMLKEGGVAVINARELPPLEGVKVYRVDSDRIASELDNPRVANLALLGFAISAGALPFSEGELKEVVSSLSPPAFKEVNLKAIERGLSSFG